MDGFRPAIGDLQPLPGGIDRRFKDHRTRSVRQFIGSAEQPDLNWAEPRVRDEFDAILRFWLGRGVDGFRVDTAHLLTEDRQYRDNPRRTAVPPSADPEAVYDSFEHRYDLDQPDVVDVYRRWHHIVAEHDAMLLGEVYLLSLDLVQRYVAEGALDLAFYFPALKTGWEAASLRAAVGDAATATDGRLAWPLSSHDDPRAAQRFGGGARGARRALAYLALLVGLPGSACILQGDELGLGATALTAADRQDPIATRNPGAVGRDQSRTPLPWAPGPNFGFTDATPWIPFPVGTSDWDTVGVQEQRTDSCHARTRSLLHIRNELEDLRGDAPLRWLTEDGDVVAYIRGNTAVALNTSDAPSLLDLGGPSEVRYCSIGHAEGRGEALLIPPEATVIVGTGQARGDRGTPTAPR